MGDCTGLVCAEALRALFSFVLSKEAGCRDVVVEFPINHRRTDNSNQPSNQEDSAQMLVEYPCVRIGIATNICHGLKMSDLIWPRP